MADESDSNATATDTAPVALAPESPAPSPSPSTETSTDTGQSKESILDAVLKVVPATTERDVLAPTDKEAPPGATEPDSHQAEIEEPETEEDDQLPKEVESVVRKKFNKLLKQRKKLQADLAELRPAAEIGSELDIFAKTNDLAGDDVAKGLHIMASLRHGDYQAFYEAIAPYVRTAQEYLGIVLPRDLTEAVRIGQMTEAAAKAYARQRFDGERSQYELQAATQAQQRSQVEAVQNDVKRAVYSFEQRLSATDPDYKAKQPVVRRVAQGMLLERGNVISSVDEALEISRAAYDEVNKQMRSFQPTPRATHPSPNGASQTPSARAAPKTLMEAAIQGLENARRGG